LIHSTNLSNLSPANNRDTDDSIRNQYRHETNQTNPAVQRLIAQFYYTNFQGIVLIRNTSLVGSLKNSFPIDVSFFKHWHVSCKLLER